MVVSATVAWVRPDGHPRRPRRFLGLLREVSGETVVVEVDGESYELPLADVERARLKPEHV